MAKSFVSVATEDDLACVFVSEYEEGAIAWVVADLHHFTLEKNRPGALPVGSFRPFDGSPVAGSPNAAWIPLSSTQ